MNRNIHNQVITTLPNGKKMTFEEIYRTYERKVDKFVRYFVKKSEDAEEVVQDTFVKLWQNKDRLMTTDSLEDTLFFLARAESINFLKSKKHLDSLSVDSLDKMNMDIPMEGNPKDTIYAKELELLIKMIVEEMPKQQQAIFKLSHFEHISNERIAEKLNISEKTVRNQLGLALSKLRTSLAYYQILIILLLSGN